MRTAFCAAFATFVAATALPTLAGAQSVEIGPGGVRVRPPIVDDDRPVVRRRVIEQRATDDDVVVEGRVRRAGVCEVRRERIWDPVEDEFVIRRTRMCD